MNDLPFRVIALPLALFMAACGSAPLPTARLASAEAGVKTATEVGAPAEPKANLYLTLAQEELEKAKAKLKDGDNEKADELLMRAEADAELALAIAKESKSQGEARQMLDQVKAAGGK